MRRRRFAAQGLAKLRAKALRLPRRLLLADDGQDAAAMLHHRTHPADQFARFFRIPLIEFDEAYVESVGEWPARERTSQERRRLQVNDTAAGFAQHEREQRRRVGEMQQLSRGI